MLEFSEMTKVFKTDLFKKPFCALNNVSFNVGKGRITGFLGANGAGKTTSMKIILDFIRPTSGSVIFGKELGSTKKEIFQNIGYLPERPFFYAHLTGRDFCKYMGKITNISHNELNQRIEYWGRKFQIIYALDREIRGYSKGMLQRLGFLVTLLHDPKLILLDEPLSGLDPVGRKELKEVMAEIYKEGKSIFFSSHIVSDVEEVSDDVIFLEKGELIYCGSVDKILSENYQTTSRIITLDQGQKKTESIEHDKKNEFIHLCLEKKIEIISIEPNRLTLEEVFYKVKNNNA